jgi:mono/diheme cytochrome c family protein
MRQRRNHKSIWGAVIASGLLLLAARLSYSDDGGGGSGDDWIAPADATKKANPVKADAAAIAAGKKVFTTTCVACHGNAGKGDGPAAGAIMPPPKDLSDAKITSQSDGALFWKISTGKLPMPAFGTPPAPGMPPQLTETERWQVIDYLRVLCPPPATQPAGQ